MSGESNIGKAGAELWARARGAMGSRAEPGEAPDDLTLAAYLDGTLDPEARDRVEAWMAGSSDALDLVVAAREALAAAPAPAPQGLLERARGLVRAQGSEQDRRRDGGGLAARLAAWLVPEVGFLRPAMWAAAVSLFLLVSISGFELGRLGAVQMVALQSIPADDLGFDLGDSTEDLL